MIENIGQFLSNYGYITVFIGTFLEGELFLLVAGFFVKHGFLSPIPTVVFSILGALSHELMYFFIGKWKGRHFLLGNKYTKRKYIKAKKLVEKYGTLSIFLVRFIYGMRIVSMTLLGATGYNMYKFIFFNIISLIIWSVFFLFIGYIFGHIATLIFGEVRNYFLLAGIIVILLGFLLYIFKKERRE